MAWDVPVGAEDADPMFAFLLRVVVGSLLGNLDGDSPVDSVLVDDECIMDLLGCLVGVPEALAAAASVIAEEDAEGRGIVGLWFPLDNCGRSLASIYNGGSEVEGGSAAVKTGWAANTLDACQ